MTTVARVERAAGDLAARLQVPRNEIRVVSTQDSDDGLRVTLEVRRPGRLFVYLVDDDGLPIPQPSGKPDGGHGFVPPPGIRD